MRSTIGAYRRGATESFHEIVSGADLNKLAIHATAPNVKCTPPTVRVLRVQPGEVHGSMLVAMPTIRLIPAATAAADPARSIPGDAHLRANARRPHVIRPDPANRLMTM